MPSSSQHDDPPQTAALTQSSNSKNATYPPLSKHQLGNRVPKRGGIIIPKLMKAFIDATGWKTVGEVPNISHCVVIGAPHTSNIDGLYAIPALLSLDIDINILAKHTLFQVPILSHFLRWAGVMPINRDQKGSVLQANIQRFADSESLFLGLAPEGTRKHTDTWKTGFYYLALGAHVPILPIAMDYASKQIRFLPLIHPTGDYEADFAKIVSQFKGVVPKHPEHLSKPLQDAL